MAQPVRVRFAPSPTGFLHIGGVRTALFNYLLAKKENGIFLLRIEDTDRERSRPEFEEEIIESLDWLGLNWDGEITRQSTRIAQYRSFADQLIEKGLAYPESEGGGRAVKFKIERKQVGFKDLVHGPIEFDSTLFDDVVIVKSDGFPTYQFACVVDDHDMGITHVIRGDDHISNTPRQILIYEAFGWTPPEFGHLPLVFGADRTPLSKRHGAVALSAYHAEGYLAEGLLNYLALLGWAPAGSSGTGRSGVQEFFTLDGLVKEFSLDGIHTTNACFDPEKLKWLNSEHIRALSDADYLKRLGQFLSDEPLCGSAAWNERFPQAALLYKTRIRTFDEFMEQTRFFFQDEISFDLDAVQKYLRGIDIPKLLGCWSETLGREGDFSKPETLEALLRKTAEGLGVKAGELIHPTRVAVSGRSVTPGLFEVMTILGKETVLKRLEHATRHRLTLGS